MMVEVSSSIYTGRALEGVEHGLLLSCQDLLRDQEIILIPRGWIYA